MGGALARALADPVSTLGLDADGWTTLCSAARSERLLGTLAIRAAGLEVPKEVDAILTDARVAAEGERRTALWEVEMARRALAGIGAPVVLLKGSAYAAAGLLAGLGRAIGDLDILVPREALGAAEAALLAAGWEWAKPDAYDDAYYRRWMHELPPLIHRTRDRMIDVHHTILPLTARIRPNAAALIADSVALENGLRVLSPADMICHAAAHLFADGELDGGLRNLWDIDRLYREFAEQQEDFQLDLLEQAWSHELGAAVERSLRLAHNLFGTPLLSHSVPLRFSLKLKATDKLFQRRLLARDGWGRGTRPATRLAFYVRSHWLRMPPAMLARHLWVKWRRQRGDRRSSTGTSSS